MFIDDSSQYGFIELIREKSESLRTFKAFKAKVEFQQGKMIKVVHSDRGGEYYNKYDEQDETLNHLQSTFKNVTLMLRIQCLVLLNRMGLQRGGITRFLIWCNVCLLIPNHLSFYGVNL